MQSQAQNVTQYITGLPDDRKEAITKIRRAILDKLPQGFSESMGYGMVGYGVPHSIYPVGYHCDPKLPLPFISIASQKNFIALYHMGMYADPELLKWFVAEYPKHCRYKLDMGKSCVRFKKIEDIPYALIGELVAKVSVSDWIACYENNLMRKL